MDCTEAQSLVVPFLENKLSLEQGIKLVQHIRGCKQCREELEFYLVVLVTTGVIDDVGTGDYSGAVEELLERTGKEWQRAQLLAKIRRVRLVMVLLFVGIALGVSMSKTAAEPLPPVSAVKPSFRLELSVPEEIAFVSRAAVIHNVELCDFTLSQQARMLVRTKLWEQDRGILLALKPGGEIHYALPEEFEAAVGYFYEKLLDGKRPEIKRSIYITLKGR